MASSRVQPAPISINWFHTLQSAHIHTVLRFFYECTSRSCVSRTIFNLQSDLLSSTSRSRKRFDQSLAVSACRDIAVQVHTTQPYIRMSVFFPEECAQEFNTVRIERDRLRAALLLASPLLAVARPQCSVLQATVLRSEASFA